MVAGTIAVNLGTSVLIEALGGSRKPLQEDGAPAGMHWPELPDHVVMGTRAPERLKGRAVREPVTEGVGGSDHNPFHLRNKYLKATLMLAGPS